MMNSNYVLNIKNIFDSFKIHHKIFNIFIKLTFF